MYFRVCARLLLSARRQLMTGSFLSSSGIFHARLRIGPGGADGRKKRTRRRARSRALKDRRNVKSWKKTRGLSICGWSKTESKWDSETSLWRYVDQSARRRHRRENLSVRNSSSFSTFLALLDYQPQSAETIARKNDGLLKRELWTGSVDEQLRLLKSDECSSLCLSFFLSHALIHREPHVERLTTSRQEAAFYFAITLAVPALCCGQAANHKLNTPPLKLKFFHSSDGNPYDSRTWLCKHFLPSEVKRRFFVRTALCFASF